MKFKSQVKKKWDKPEPAKGLKRELYKFINGVAKVPGMWHKQSPYKQYTITIKEFNQFLNA